MPNAVPVDPSNPTISNPPVTLATGVVPRGDGFGQATDPFIFDLGQQAFTASAMTTVITGAPASCTIQLQASSDGSTWTTIATSTSTSGDTQFANSGSQYTSLRVNVSAVSGGTSPTIRVVLSAFVTAAGVAQVVTGTVSTNPATVTAANILSGSATASNTASAQTIITIPAGRTWYGTVSAEIVQTAGTGLVSANINTAGAGVTPAAAVNLCTVSATAVTAAGNVSDQQTSGPFYVVAPGGNSVTLTLTNTSATTNVSHASALGILL